MIITDPGHGISMGGLVLVEEGQPVEHPEGFTTEVSADGMTWGNPDVAVAQIISALYDGDLVNQTHVGNREPVMRVRISGATADELARGERALAQVVGKPVELTWQPPDYFAPPTVFEVLHSRMDFEFDDLTELRCERTYLITMTALPRGRSVEKTITPAVTASAPSVVDSGSSTTGWSLPNGPTGAALSVASGAVTATYDATILNNRSVSPFYGTTMRRSATITTTNKYIGVDWKTTSTGYFFVGNGPELLVEVRREPAPTATYTRSWYKVPDDVASITVLEITLDRGGNKGSAGETLSVDQIVQANALPASGTTQQNYATITPGGSVSTEGDVLVQHPTGGLGTVVVYSHPAGGGYSPPLRPWLVSSDPVTISSASVSGGYHSLNGLTRFNIPISSVPEGSVHLWARVGLSAGSPGDVSINWSAWSLQGGVTVGDPQFGYRRVKFPVLNGWVYAPIARLTLPTTRVGPAGYVYIDMQKDAGAAQTILLDEAWLFAMDKGQLTIVDCGTGTPSVGTVHNRLRIKAPSLEAPEGRIEIATRSDWADAFVPPYSKVLCDQRTHRFDPATGSAVLTATNVNGASTSFEHYRRAHSNIGTF